MSVTENGSILSRLLGRKKSEPLNSVRSIGQPTVTGVRKTQEARRLAELAQYEAEQERLFRPFTDLIKIADHVNTDAERDAFSLVTGGESTQKSNFMGMLRETFPSDEAFFSVFQVISAPGALPPLNDEQVQRAVSTFARYRLETIYNIATEYFNDKSASRAVAFTPAMRMIILRLAKYLKEDSKEPFSCWSGKQIGLQDLLPVVKIILNEKSATNVQGVMRSGLWYRTN